MFKNVKTLRVTRLSQAPNKFGSYAYRIEDADNPDVQELLESAQGVYEGQEGGHILYSRSYLGKLNTPTNVQFRLVEQRVNGVGTGRSFINLINAGLDTVAEFAETIKTFERFGVSNAVGAAAAFASSKPQSVSAAPAKAAAAAPAATPADAVDNTADTTGADEKEPLDTKALAGQEAGAA